MLFIILFILLWPFCNYCVQSVHLKGTWNPSTRFLLLTKFGFQRTQSDEIEATRGYIYGNITVYRNYLGIII